jgi:hypothetical protein
VKDEITEKPIPSFIVGFNGDQYVSDSLGKVVLNNVEYKSYDISLAADGYVPANNMIRIWSDSTITFSMLNKHIFKIDLTTLNRKTGDPVGQALINYNDRTTITNSGGIAVLNQLSPGLLEFSIEHTSFITHSQSLYLSGDTSLTVRLTPAFALVNFLIIDINGPLEGAKVRLEGSEAITSNLGQAWFLLQALEMYAYSIEKDGFEPISDSMYLEIDTTVTIILSPASGRIEDQLSSGICVYPNPTTGLIFVDIPVEKAALYLCDNTGRELKTFLLRKGLNSIKLDGIPEGVYYLSVRTNKVFYTGKVVVGQ